LPPLLEPEIQEMAPFWSSSILTGFGGKSDATALESALKTATQSEKLDVAKEDLTFIAQCSHHEDDRRLIMKHLHMCLNDSSSSKYRCIITGLTVGESLLRHGSPDLVEETCAGKHFDLVQRLSFLEKFEYSYDKRVEGMIRRKALSLRGLYLEKQNILEEAPVLKTRGAVFHSDDTDDDLSDAEEESRRSKVQPRKVDYLHEESTTDDQMTDGESSVSPRSSPNGLLQTPRSPDLLAAIQAPAVSSNDMIDLLNMAPATASEKSAAATMDFFDLDAASQLSSMPQPAPAPTAGQETNLLDW